MKDYQRYLGTFVALAVCTTLLFYLKLGDPKRREDQGTRLYILPKNALQSIRLTEGDQSLLLIGEKDRWVLEGTREPVALVQMDQFLSDFAAPQALPLYGNEVEAKNFELSRYGLDPPRKTLELLSESGIRKLLLFGKETAVGGNVYVKMPETKAVYLMSQYAADFTADASEWREPKTEPKETEE